MKLKVVVNGSAYEVEVEDAEEPAWLEPSAADVPGLQSSILPTARLAASSDFDESKVCRSPLAGVVVRLHTKPGQPVEANELLLVLDAMKMEIKVAAQSAGTIKSIEVAPGDAVKPNQVLVCFE